MRGLGEPPHLGVELVERARVDVADDRDDEPLLGLHGDADVVALEQHEVVAVDARVQLRELLQRLRDRLAASSGSSRFRSTSVKSHSSTQVTGGISRCARVRCSNICRLTPRIGSRRSVVPRALRRRRARPPR